MPSTSYSTQPYERFRFDLLIVYISLIIANTLVSLACLLYLNTFGFILNFSEIFQWTHQLPFLLFEIIILILMEFFSIYFASRFYFTSNPVVSKKNRVRLIIVWLFLILFMFVIAIQFFLSSYEISELILDNYFIGFYDYKANSEFVDLIQTKFGCCGTENSTSWDLNKAYSEKESKIPNSCCRPEYTICDKANSTQLYNEGCAKSIIIWSNESVFIFLILWSLLILLSIGFCYLLKKIIQDNKSTIVAIKALFGTGNESDSSTGNKNLLDYEKSFKKCKPNQIAFQSNKDHDNSSTNSSPDSNLNKFTKFSQIKYSKVMKSNSKADDDYETELTCHHDDGQSSREDSYTDEEDEVNSLKYHHSANELNAKKVFKKVNNLMLANYNDSFQDTHHQDIRNEINKDDRKIKRKDKLDQNEKFKRDLKKTKAKLIDKQNRSTNKLDKSIDKLTDKKQSNYKIDEKNKLNYNNNLNNYEHIPDYKSTSDRDHSLSSNSISSSELNDSQIDNRNLIHSKTVDKMYNLDKLKNKFIEPYFDDQLSYLTDRFDDSDSNRMQTKGKIKFKQAYYLDNLNKKIKQLNQILNEINFSRHNLINLKKLDQTKY